MQEEILKLKRQLEKAKQLLREYDICQCCKFLLEEPQKCPECGHQEKSKCVICADMPGTGLWEFNDELLEDNDED